MFLSWQYLFRLEKVSSEEKERHYKCAKRAEDVQTHAKCVSKLLDADAEQAKRNRWAKLLGKRRLANRGSQLVLRIRSITYR